MKKVTDSEYTLKRRQLEVADFHTYLKYVISLDKLLVARVKRLEANTTKVTKELHDMLHAIQKTLDNHIIYIFDRSVRRFASEVVLWNDYIAFLQRKEAVTALNGVFGKALSLYPKNEEFWLQAAVHELEANSNVHSARVTLQRALRAVPASSKLWLRYFELELWNALRSTERQKALEIVEDYEALQGAPMVVFTHALNAVQDIQAVLEIYSACETVGGDFALKMQDILIAKHGGRKEVWQYLAISALSACTTKPDAELTDGASNKRKASDTSATTALATVTPLSEGLEKVVAVLNQGAAYNAEHSSENSNTIEFGTMAITTLHQSLLQAQQILSEVDMNALMEAAPVSSASAKKKPRKTDKAEESGARGNVEKLGEVFTSILGAVSAFSDGVNTARAAEKKNGSKSEVIEHSSASVARAVQFEVYLLAETLSLNLDSSSVLSERQLAAWVASAVPVLAKYVQKHFQYQLSSSAISAECTAAVDGLLVPVASLLAYLAQNDDKLSVTEVQSALSALFVHASVLVITPNGSELLKQAVSVVQGSGLSAAAASALQSVITTTHALVSPTDRAVWCEYYVESALSSAQDESPVEALAVAYRWVDGVIASKPHLFQPTALAAFYEFVLDTAQAQLPAAETDASTQDSVRKFIEAVAEKAVEKVPQEVSFWNVLDQAQQQRGDHKSATHTRWRRDRAIAGSA